MKLADSWGVIGPCEEEGADGGGFRHQAGSAAAPRKTDWPGTGTEGAPRGCPAEWRRLATRTHRPTPPALETLRPVVLWESTLCFLLPSREDSLFLPEHTRAPARQPAPGHLTSNNSRSFMSAGGKCQVPSAPVSGHRPPLTSLLSPVARGPCAQDSTGWHSGALGTDHTHCATPEAGSGGHWLGSLQRAG